MNKNLKKVISSVVALALSLGSLSAFAASYSDVAETANYATAVNELSALGIVNGYDDGTFQPDKKVTRAEVTKMVVAALAQTAAADAAKGATAFSDVAADHWASGFINVGSSSSGFINGMGDGTFAPEANVTYAQLVKMLVTSLGYGGMALQEGGYPTGYITVGDRIGVTKAVVANANDELTRGQVALLIDNSVNIPLLVTTVWSAANPEYEIKDGKGSDFQTLLTEYHDTYKVEGKIVETSKSGNVDAGEAKFEIAVADRFDDDEYYTRSDSTDERVQTVKVAEGIDATANLFAYSTALIYKNSDDEYELISLSSSAKSKTVELAAGGFDDENSAYKGDAANKISDFDEPLKFYATDAKTGKVTDYKLSHPTSGNDDKTNAELWVNGKQIGIFGDDLDVNDIQKYIVDNEVGTVTLVDAPQEGKATTDGYYDYVLVEYYMSGMVDSVNANGTIYFDSKQTGLPSSFKLDKDDVENGDLEYTITLDGKEIDFTDLQEDDVLAIAYDVTANKFVDSEFYDIIVTRGTVEGKVSSSDTDDETFTVNGTEYKYNEDKFSDGYDKEAVGMEVTLYVDAFGRIVKLEEASSSKKYAIAENVWNEPGPDADYIKIVLPDGTTKDYEAKNDEDADDAKAIVFDGAKKKDIWERVITYKVNSSNQIYSIEPVKESEKTDDKDDYSERNNKIGSVKLNDNTSILDASDYIEKGGKVSDLKTVSKLIDDSEYTAYGFDKLSDNTYSFVIITDGIGGYSDDTQVAVFVKAYKDTDSEGDSVDAITVLYEGKEQNIIIDELAKDGSIDDINDLNKGDVIVFKQNGSAEITQIDLIAAMGLCKGTNRVLYGNRDHAVITNLIAKWNPDLKDDDGKQKYDTDVELDYGVITDKNSSSVAITPIGGVAKDETVYDLDDNTIVYVYDYTEGAKSALYVGTTSDITKTSIGNSFKKANDDIDWDAIDADASMKASVNYAFVKTIKDEVKEIVVVVAPGDEDE